MDRLPVFLSFFLHVWKCGASATILDHEAPLKMEVLAKDLRSLVTVEQPYQSQSPEFEVISIREK